MEVHNSKLLLEYSCEFLSAINAASHTFAYGLFFFERFIKASCHLCWLTWDLSFQAWYLSYFIIVQKEIYTLVC